MHYIKSELMTFLCWPSKAGFDTRTNIIEILLTDIDKYEYAYMYKNILARPIQYIHDIHTY